MENTENVDMKMKVYGEMLDEVCKVSAMRATGALSKFLGSPVGINMQPVEMTSLDELNDIINSEVETVNVYMPITGVIPGVSFFIYSQKDALYLCDILFHKEHGTSKNFDANEQSAVLEVANIVLGNFLNAFANSLQLDNMLHKSPNFETGPFTETFHKILEEIGKEIKQTIVKISFNFQQVNLKGYVLIVFEKEKMLKVLEELSINWND